MMQDSLSEKVRRLHEVLEGLEGGALVAFSGGADSALLAVEAAGAVKGPCMAVTADSPTLPREELRAAVAFARAHALKHETVATAEMDNPAFAANDAYRCYHCKSELFAAMEKIARERGFRWLLFGAIADDAGDWRPGMEAAREAGARAPLLEAGFTKADVRSRSRDLGLETWEKPQTACLSSRFPTGRAITLPELQQVERAESFLHGRGFRQCRVRLMEDSARLELEADDMERITADPALRAAVLDELKRLGFRFVTVDLDGFRSGSLSRHLLEKRHGIRRDA
jgi:uncharacterized protein